jgi:hypothetical protein
MTAESESNPVSEHPILFTLAVLTGAALVAAGFLLVGAFTDSEEAPIRVKNGSLEIELLSNAQKWEPVGGGSRNWRIPDASRFKDEYVVMLIVTPEARCGGSLVATGPDVVLTYSDGEKIRIQATGKHTFVKPDNGTLTNSNDPQKLDYTVSGYLRTIAVGSGANPAEMCTFTDPKQLLSVYLLNVP